MKRLAISLALLATAVAAQAQISVGKGQLSGSIESNNIYYMEDSALAGATPEDRFGSNSYLKVDYTLGRFSAGLQADAYLPVLQGFDMATYGAGHKFVLSSKYIQWQDRNFAVRVGDIFDQFGSGILFRTWEDRALGFNNSLEGVRGAYNFNGYVSVKGVYGRPRLYDEYASSWVRGADMSVSISEITGWDNGMLNLEGSYLNRHQNIDEVPDAEMLGLTSSDINMFSGRINFAWQGLELRGEYVGKCNADLYSPIHEAARGNAWLAEAAYDYNRFAVSASFRRLEHMSTMASLISGGTGNVINYLPALTRQYTYMLTNLNPYQVNAEGEIGGQADIYYSLRNRTDRSRYWNFHANFSTFYTLEENGGGEHRLLWRDINVDVERQWNRRLKTTLLYSRQEWNPSHGGINDDTYVSDIFVADITYKFDKKKSLRVEAQYLLSGDYEGDWAAALVEFNVAPSWSVYASDMYNLGNETDKMHYYNAGVSWTHSRTRLQLSYGRNRAGYVCSGGVCRFSPAYTGFNLVLTSSF